MPPRSIHGSPARPRNKSLHAGDVTAIDLRVVVDERVAVLAALDDAAEAVAALAHGRRRLGRDQARAAVGAGGRRSPLELAGPRDAATDGRGDVETGGLRRLVPHVALVELLPGGGVDRHPVPGG